MTVFLNTKEVVDIDSLTGRYKNKSICISIDSSKTNTAICVMSRTYHVLDVFEFNGSQDKDILLLIKTQRDIIRSIFSEAHIIDGGIEDIITKKDETNNGKYSEGLKHHHARYVITAVFVSIICCFQDYFDITLETISNQTWKSTVLPKELNKRDVYKGSVYYVKDKYPLYASGQKPDDICDAICIGEYMKIRKGLNKNDDVIDISDDVEFEINPCKYRLYSNNQVVSKKVGIQFRFNPNLSIDYNARSMANKIEAGQLGWTTVPIDCVSIENIYELCAGKFDESTKIFKLIVKRV